MALDQSALLELLDALRRPREHRRHPRGARVHPAGTDRRRGDRSDRRSALRRHGDPPTTATTPARGSCRPRTGDIDLRIPKLRDGAFFPSLLEPRRRIVKALWAGMMEAYVHAVSTRKVDDLVAALGVETGVSHSTVSRLCGESDEVVAAFRDRPLGHVAFRYVFLDATYVKAHEGARVQGDRRRHRGSPHRERGVLGVAVGDSEDSCEASKPAAWRTSAWSSPMPTRASRVPSPRSCSGPRVATLPRALHGRNVPANVPKGSVDMVAVAVRAVFAQPTAQEASAQLDRIAGMLGNQFPKVEAVLRGAKEDLLAFAAFPTAHWKKLWSTNPLERGQQADQAAHRRRGHAFISHHASGHDPSRTSQI